jgi:hypothetical protein
MMTFPMKIQGETTKKVYETEYNIYPAIYTCKDTVFSIEEYKKDIQNLSADTSLSILQIEYCIASYYAKLGMIDSAFYYLNNFIDTSFDDRVIIVDNTWNILRQDTLKWQFIVHKIEQLYLQDIDYATNKELALELFYMGIKDQEYRLYKPHLHQIIGDTNEIKQDLEQRIKRNERFEAILKEYGFPSISMVGHLGNSAAFLLFQHSTYIRKYYHLIKKSYRAGEIRPMFYAMITDRYLTECWRKQIYGSQFYQPFRDKKSRKFRLWRVKDFENVNQRRKEMGFHTTVEENANRSNWYIPSKYYKNKRKDNE